MAPRVLEAAKVVGEPDEFEYRNVHTVYDEIAPHFSSTRYKPWPIIANFLYSLTTGWVGLDSGTGNGKYLPLSPGRPGDIWTIGLDRSKNLLNIARKAGATSVFREVILGNVLDNPWRMGIFDYAISIATIHHLATPERRLSAVKRLLQAVSPSHGRILIYVWAIEQDDLSKRRVLIDEDSVPDKGMDVVVPWVLSKELNHSDLNKAAPQVFNRYYHLFSRGELRGLVEDAAKELSLSIGPQHGKSPRGVEIIQDGWERSNYYVELKLWQG